MYWISSRSCAAGTAPWVSSRLLVPQAASLCPLPCVFIPRLSALSGFSVPSTSDSAASVRPLLRYFRRTALDFTLAVSRMTRWPTSQYWWGQRRIRGFTMALVLRFAPENPPVDRERLGRASRLACGLPECGSVCAQPPFASGPRKVRTWHWVLPGNSLPLGPMALFAVWPFSQRRGCCVRGYSRAPSGTRGATGKTGNLQRQTTSEETWGLVGSRYQTPANLRPDCC